MIRPADPDAPADRPRRRIGSLILAKTITPRGRAGGEMIRASIGRLALSTLVGLTLGGCVLPNPGVAKATPSTSAGVIASPTPPSITPPTNLVRPGTLTFLSDTTYPPQESIDPSTQHAVGFDIDIAKAIAVRLGLAATFQTTNSPQMVGALLAKKGDAIISALQITPDLQRQLAFVAYFRAGQAILVRKGDGSTISGIRDLCGKKVAVQVQSPEENTIDEANGGLCKDMKITKQVFPTDLQAVLILKQRGVDCRGGRSHEAPVISLDAEDRDHGQRQGEADAEERLAARGGGRECGVREGAHLQQIDDDAAQPADRHRGQHRGGRQAGQQRFGQAKREPPIPGDHGDGAEGEKEQQQQEHHLEQAISIAADVRWHALSS